MEHLRIIDYLKKPQLLLGRPNLDILELMTKQYPYCQFIQIMLSIAKNKSKNIFYENPTELAALYIGDRSLLYQNIVNQQIISLTDSLPSPSAKKEISRFDQHRQASKHNIDELLDKFIKENPSIQKPKSAFYSAADKAGKSLTGEEEFATETLAKIYIKLNRLEKALKIYQKLSLLYPEKSNYFALQIEKLKNQKEE